jgi:Tfp pilus assembly protein PilW
MRHKRDNNNGFTLVEIIVAMSIFIVVISVVVSLFAMGLRGQRKVITLQNAQENARFLLGFIAKELRMSQINSVTATSLDITRADGTNVIYLFDDIEKQIERDDGSGSGSINSDEVLVTGSFYGLGLGSGDNQQPRITIVMKVETTGTKPEERAEISVQTTLCQRDLEYLVE